MTINPAAPVVSRAEIEVGADFQTVWDVVTRVADGSGLTALKTEAERRTSDG